MKYINTLLITSLALLGCSLTVLAADNQSATLDINSRGMSATAPNFAPLYTCFQRVLGM